MDTFLKSFLILKNFGMASGFRAINDLPRAHCDETVFKGLASQSFIYKSGKLFKDEPKRFFFFFCFFFFISSFKRKYKYE